APPDWSTASSTKTRAPLTPRRRALRRGTRRRCDERSPRCGRRGLDRSLHRWRARPIECIVRGALPDRRLASRRRRCGRPGGSRRRGGGGGERAAAVAAARRAFPAWAALGPEGRLPILKRFAETVRAQVQRIAAVETADNGSPLAGNIARGVPRAAHNIDFFADWALKLGETIESPEVTNRVRFDPAGVAALITPWNAPFMLTTWKGGPALAAGNPVRVKPPEWAPLTCSLLADLAVDVGLPPGVLNVVQGIGEEAGAALAQHGDIDRLSFTGSTETAKLIGQATARSLTPVSFEL